jgi:hypothetical protein
VELVKNSTLADGMLFVIRSTDTHSTQGALVTFILRSVFGLAAIALPFLFLLLVAVVYG